MMVCSGNFLEMYDFMAFGYYAGWIGRAFFPAGTQFVSLMLALGTFGAGFLMRPIGALVLGAYIDRHGRRAGLLLTLSMMALGTASIACMPSYATIGILAPLLIVGGRLAQGLSAGAQVGGVTVYLSEIATPGHKGFYVAWQSGSQQLSVIAVSLLGVAVSSFVSPRQMDAWGWRVPFIVGCSLIPLTLLLRHSLPETASFLARTDRPAVSSNIVTAISNWRIMLLGSLLATMTTVSFYLITAYTPTYGANELHLSARSSLMVAFFVGISNFVLLPVMGALSDKVGRRPLLFCCSLVMLVTAYPVLWWLVAQPSFGRLLTVELWLSLVYAGYNGAMIVYLTEIMPPSIPTAGFSLAYGLATAIFGGFTPAVCTYLIHLTGNRAMPGVWLSGAAACGMMATILLSQQRFERAEDPGREIEAQAI